MSIWRFADSLPEVPPEYRLTLGEGKTPLLRSRRIGPTLGLSNLFFKLESSNPSGSYKDRFAAIAISAMMAEKKSRCIATSSGNTGAALAAYCAAAGLRCEIAIVESAPRNKLVQMLAYGAHLRRVRGFGIDQTITNQVFDHLVKQGNSPDTRLQISAYRYSAIGMCGVQTISYELAEQAEAARLKIDHAFCPTGGGGLALALARGMARIRLNTAVHVVQPEGNDTMATALQNGVQHAISTTCTTTISGLQVPSVIDGNETIHECRATGGTGFTVTDAAALHCQAQLANEEGILCEPAAAVSLAGVFKAVSESRIDRQSMIVCLITGSGFKDNESLETMTRECACPTIEISEL